MTKQGNPMAAITFITADGEKVVVSATTGTLMEAAVGHDVPGIEGNCGGVCSCATCHVRIAPEWTGRVGPPDDTEREMLDFVDDAGPGSRLSCQIELTEALDGLVVHVANH
jgi:ferredoxin, 2Fe-2S